jgi:hypothetical protein
MYFLTYDCDVVEIVVQSMRDARRVTEWGRWEAAV